MIDDGNDDACPLCALAARSVLSREEIRTALDKRIAAGNFSPSEYADSDRLKARWRAALINVVLEVLAARPVLSREALREAVLAGLRAGWRDEFSAASVADVVVDHLADVLTAGGEQRG